MDINRIKKLETKYEDALMIFKEKAEKREIPIWRAERFYDGYVIVFYDKDMKRLRCDAAVHGGIPENRFAKDAGSIEWETIRFPWDRDDVTRMSVDTLIDNLEKFDKGDREGFKDDSGNDIIECKKELEKQMDERWEELRKERLGE